MAEDRVRPKQRPETEITYDDLRKIEKVVWDEARGEGVEGRNAVRGVIFNRLASDRFGDTVDDVLVKDQFEGIGRYGSVDAIPAPDEEIEAQLNEAADYIQLADDPTDGRTFFLNKETASADFSGPDPMTVGDHTFYRGFEGQEPVSDTNFSHNIKVSYDDADRQMAELDMARGGLALSESRKGIRTQAGMDMAKNKKQLDRKKADVNGDGEVSDYEKQRAEALQNAEMPSMSCGGIMGDPMMTGVDPVSGNPIPVGATAENVRDDIPVNISQDEYVLPAHVVKYHGLKHIMELQSEAEMGLMALQADGLIQSIGGEDEDAEEGPDGEGSEDAKVSAKDTETEEGESSPETTETPEGNEIELAGVDVSDEEFEDDETEEYKDSAYPTKSKSRMYGMMKKPKVTFIV